MRKARSNIQLTFLIHDNTVLYIKKGRQKPVVLGETSNNVEHFRKLLSFCSGQKSNCKVKLLKCKAVTTTNKETYREDTGPFTQPTKQPFMSGICQDINNTYSCKPHCKVDCWGLKFTVESHCEQPPHRATSDILTSSVQLMGILTRMRPHVCIRCLELEGCHERLRQHCAILRQMVMFLSLADVQCRSVGKQQNPQSNHCIQ